MRTHLIPSLVLTACMMFLTMVLYVAIVRGIGLFSPQHGGGFTVTQAEKTCYANLGQTFDEDRYFWSRPSATGYNTAGSGGSNKGPSNPEYLAQVQARIDTFLAHHPGVALSQIPADMVTASGSGLDPHISPRSALIQVDRVARIRALPPEKVKQLVEDQIEDPWLGLFGPARVNVLKLNLSLDRLK